MEILLEREWLPRSTCQSKANTSNSKESSDAGAVKSVEEVLDITEAAIRALNKPSQDNRTLGTTNSSMISAVKSCESALSPSDWYSGSFQYAFTDRQLTGGVESSGVCSESHADSETKQPEGSRRESLDSRSSTASGILKKATTLTDQDISLSSTTQLNMNSLGNHSLISTTSDTKSNISNSGFLTGNLKKVKLSSKKLKEVDSPFDESILSQNVSKFSGEKLPESLVKRNLSELEKHKKGQRKALPCGEKVDIFASNKDKMSRSHKSDAVQKTPPQAHTHTSNVTRQEFSGLFSPLSSVEHNRNEDRYCEVLDRSSFVSRHIPMDVVVHLTSPSESSIGSDSKFTTMSAGNSAGLRENISQHNGKPSPKNVVPSSERFIHSPENYSKEKIISVDRHDKCVDTEIITVPETIVTVQARDGNLSQASATSLNSEIGIPQKDLMASVENQPPPQSKPITTKNQIHRGLLQGKVVEGSDPSKVRNTEDTVITQFNLTEKQKHLKNSIAKSRQVSVPVKRLVQPKIVQTEKRQKNKKSDSADRDASADPITTAAVAASAAVAATQPFLQAQKEVEHKMAQILERLAALQMGNSLTSTGDSGIGTESLRNQRNDKMVQLEKQVEDLTLKRLDHVEKMQEQYMDVQAQLLGISRNRPSETPSGNVNYHKSPPTKGRYRPVESEKAVEPKRKENEKILDTPAPRRTAPTPVVYEAPPVHETKLDTPVKRPKPRGLLETILAETQSPSYAKTPPTLRDERTSGEHETSDLVHDLEDLKTRMKKVLSDVEHVNTDLRNQQSPKKQEIRTSPLSQKDAPLDAYLRMKDPVGLSSPYPVVEKDQGNAPVRDNFKDAQDVLQYVRQSRHLLEANLQAILRKRNEADVFTLLEQLSTDSMSTEKYNFRKKVDQQITAMQSDLEKEILEELLKIEEAKERSFMIPEKDVSHGKVSGARGQVAGRQGVKQGGGITSRVDSGLRKPMAREARPGLKKPPQDNVGYVRPAVKPYSKPKSSVKPYETEEYMTRVYGKADYQNQRSMQKPAPYLHYQTSSKPKAARPVPKVISPDSKSKHPRDHYYFSSSDQLGGGPTQGQLIHMAIPLGKPRQEHTGPPPKALVTSTPQATSTPLTQTPQAAQRVAFISIQDHEDDKKEKSEGVERTSKKPNLTVQTLPQVNIDDPVVPDVKNNYAASPARRPVDKTSAHAENEEEKRRDERIPDLTDESPEDFDKPQDGQETSGVNETIDENVETEDVINLPGFQQKTGTYHGPSFPPRAPPMVDPGPSSNILAGDIHRRELLQTHATQWLEQELMARVLSEITSRQFEQQSHSQLDDNQKQTKDEDSESAVVDAIGEAGFQMFVEVGMDVDNDLVRSLINQVILEKIQATLSQRDRERPSTPDDESRKSPVPKPRTRSNTTPRQQSEHERYARTTIPTPQPTPEGSMQEDLDDESLIYTPDPSMSLSSEKDPPPVKDGRENSAPDYGTPPALEVDDRRAAATPNFSPRSQRSLHDVDTPEPSLKDLPPQFRGIDVSVGTDYVHDATQPMWGGGHPLWNLGGAGMPFLPVMMPANQRFDQLFNQLPISQPAPSTSAPVDPQPSRKSDKRQKNVRPPSISEPESDDVESEVTSEDVPLTRPDAASAKAPETAGKDDKPSTKVIMVDRPTSPASNLSQESMASETMNYVSEGQWLISARSVGEMRNHFPAYLSSGLFPGDDTFHGMEELDADEISEGEIIQRLQNLQNPIVVMGNQLNQRPFSFVENRFRNTQPAIPSRSIGEIDPSMVRNQARSLPSVVKVQEQHQVNNDHSPGELPHMTEPPLMPESQTRPSTSRGMSARDLVHNQSRTLDESANAQGAAGGAHLQSTIPPRQTLPSGSQEQGPIRLADMRKRGGGIGAGPIMSTTDRPTRSQPGRRRRSGSREMIIDSRDTLAGTLSGGTFSHDSREFLVSNDSFQSGRSLNILDLNTENPAETLGTVSERDLQTPDQMNLDEILHSPEYYGRTFSQSEFGSTGQQSESGMTQSFSRSGLQRQNTWGSTRSHVPNADLGASLGTSGQFLDSLESSLTTDQLVQRQPPTMNSTQGTFDWLVGAQGTPSTTQGAAPNGRSLMATVNLESTTSIEDGSEAQLPSVPRSLSVKVPLMGQHDESSEESIEDVSDL